MISGRDNILYAIRFGGSVRAENTRKKNLHTETDVNVDLLASTRVPITGDVIKRNPCDRHCTPHV